MPVACGSVGLPPSAVAASRALQPWVLQPTLPSTTPRAGDTKLAEAGWRPTGTVAPARLNAVSAPGRRDAT